MNEFINLPNPSSGTMAPEFTHDLTEMSTAARGQGSTTSVRFEIFTAVTMKNGVFWDINTQFVPNRRHITSLLQIPAS
jgi:hypothetical protein